MEDRVVKKVRQWDTKAQTNGTVNQPRQWIRSHPRLLSFLLLSAVMTIGTSLFSLLLDVPEPKDPEALGLLPPIPSNHRKYPPPRYNIPQSDTFLRFWKESHTHNFTKHIIGWKYTSVGSENQVNNDPPKMLLGIITLAKSRERRKLIRETYLNYYNDMETMRNQSTFTSHKLCSLRRYHKDCQIAYVFVAAVGNTESSIELMHPNASFPLTVPGPPENDDEDDVIYLNVREHMNKGKIPTWFKYAVTISHPEGNMEFDYIAKVDDDTLLFTGNLMDMLERDLLKPHRINPDGLVYGGTINSVSRAWKNRKCNHANTWNNCPIYGPIWMLGPFYFLSRDLADYITSDVVDRIALTYVEDVSTASFVWSHPGNVTVVEIPRYLSLMSYDYGSDSRRRSVSTKYERQIYGHSEDACWAWTEPYFKRPWNVRKMWRQYLLWNWSGQTTAFKYRYQLHDFPPPPQSVKKKAQSSSLSSQNDVVVVHHSDYIYASDDFDASPIVVKAPYNMVFFPITGVADVAWRCLIRRLLGYTDWDNSTRQFDGLTYLADFDIPTASSIMSSKNFTRVMFVRNPLHRIQSNYMKLVLDDEKNNHEMIRGCNCSRDCGAWSKEDGPCHEEKTSFASFLKGLVSSCDQPYWRPMSRRMEPRYKRKLDFIGTYESLSLDADKLFRRLLNLGTNTTLAEALGWSESLKEHFSRFHNEYQSSDAPHFFRDSWSELFATMYRFDISSTYWNYDVTLPSGISTTTSPKKLKKQK